MKVLFHDGNGFCLFGNTHHAFWRSCRALGVRPSGAESRVSDYALRRLNEDAEPSVAAREVPVCFESRWSYQQCFHECYSAQPWSLSRATASLIFVVSNNSPLRSLHL